MPGELQENAISEDKLERWSRLRQADPEDLLRNEDPEKRKFAFLTLLSNDGDRETRVIREALLREENSSTLMIVSVLLLSDSTDNTPMEALGRAQVSEKVLFAILQAAKYKKRAVGMDLLQRLLESPSVFVRLAAADYSCRFRVPVAHPDEFLQKLRSDIKAKVLEPGEAYPSPIFTDKKKLMWKFYEIRGQNQIPSARLTKLLLKTDGSGD